MRTKELIKRLEALWDEFPIPEGLGFMIQEIIDELIWMDFLLPCCCRILQKEGGRGIGEHPSSQT